MMTGRQIEAAKRLGFWLMVIAGTILIIVLAIVQANTS
jgi:hypothetical protein